MINAEALALQAESHKYDLFCKAIKTPEDAVEMAKFGADFYGEWFPDSLNESLYNFHWKDEPKAESFSQAIAQWAETQTPEYQEFLRLQKKFAPTGENK